MDEEIGTPVYLVLEWDDYYPSIDNTVAIFFNRRDAEVFILEYADSQTDNWLRCDHLEIVERKVR